MNLLKRLIGLLCVIAIVSTCSQYAYAYNVGDVIGEVVYTDIVASINNYNIASYNMMGYTMIVVEDLRNYGFNVDWDDATRSLNVTRSDSNIISSSYIAPTLETWKIGKKAADVLYTDIATYFNGKFVISSNIGGKTVVNFNDLSVFGEVSYIDSTRSIDLYVNDGLMCKEKTSTQKNSAGKARTEVELGAPAYPKGMKSYTEITGIEMKRYIDTANVYVYGVTQTVQDDITDYIMHYINQGWKYETSRDYVGGMEVLEFDLVNSSGSGIKCIIVMILAARGEIWVSPDSEGDELNESEKEAFEIAKKYLIKEGRRNVISANNVTYEYDMSVSGGMATVMYREKTDSILMRYEPDYVKGYSIANVIIVIDGKSEYANVSMVLYPEELLVSYDPEVKLKKSQFEKGMDVKFDYRTMPLDERESFDKHGTKGVHELLNACNKILSGASIDICDLGFINYR